MQRVESNADILLKAPDHSTPSKLDEFAVPELGGGYVVVNLYGEYSLSIGSVDIGTIGNTWADSEEALESIYHAANTMSDKSQVTDLKIGGAAMLLYFNKPELDTPANRRRLAFALAKEIPSFSQTNILCIPGKGCSLTDLDYIYKANEQLKVKKEFPSSPSETSLATADEMTSGNGNGAQHHRRSRSRSLSSDINVTEFDFPVAAAMISAEAMQNDPLVEAASQSAYGAISTLTKSKKWAIAKIVLAGCSPVAKALYWLLVKEGYDVFMSDPNQQKIFDAKVKEDKIVPWDQVLTTKCDVLVLCSDDCPVMSEANIAQLNCLAVVSASDFLLPWDEGKREKSRVSMERKDIFEFADGLADVGAIARAYALSNPSQNFGRKDIVELGAKVMQKKLHLDGIVKQYDTEDKRKFYSMVLADEVDDIGGLKLGLGTIIHNSSDSMTQWMWNKARGLCPAYRALKNAKKKIHYIDLGAGNGSAARWICRQSPRIHVKCVNISPQQNAENRQLSDEQGLGGQVSVVTTSFEQLPAEYSSSFDGCISQDSFIHAYNKLHALSEAFRVTTGGGWLMVSDLMSGGETDNVTAEELREFAEKNNVASWVTPERYVEIAKQAGWSEVHFIDCTAQIKVSLQNLLTKILKIIESGEHGGLNLKLLQTHRLSLANRIGQIDRSVFKWGIIAARKPYDVLFMTNAPVTPEPHPMMFYSTNGVDGNLSFGTDVVVLNIKDHMPRDKIMELPSTVRLMVTMSAGLDHIDMDAATERGIRVRRAARFAIVKSVADYLLSNIIFGLRNGFQNVGVPFPGKNWDLSWNADGVDLDRAKIGFIGMGAISDETCRRIRALSTECEIVYHIPEGVRSRFEEGTHRMSHVGIADLLSTCDVVIPLVPLTKTTTGLINYRSLTMMKKTALFINMARGKVVDTVALHRALKEGLIRHAILDTTDPGKFLYAVVF